MPQTLNGKTYTRTFDAGTRTITDQTPTGRQRVSTLDSRGRLLTEHVAALEPLTYGYDAQGRLHTIARGTGTAARVYTLDYDIKNRLSAITDPLSHILGLAYDTADRVATQTFPDSKVVTFGYDPNGNVASVSPPARPVHSFDYTSVDLEKTYTPPAVGGPVATTYTYNLDRQLTQVLRPDGQTVNLTYGPTVGRLQSLTTPTDTVTFGYDPTHGQLTSLTSAAGENLTYAYDGALVTSATWAGPTAGSVSATYDAFFRVSETKVNGANAASRGYDQDGLLTQAGALTLIRDPQDGLVAGTTLGSVADTLTHNGFGELETYTASPTGGGSAYIQTTYTRDALGRIQTKTETMLGTTHTTVYGYDLRGRLETVTTDGSSTVTYTYDDNGNRLTRQTSGGGIETGTYDDQDRLLTYNGATHAYTANGELQSKTVGGQTTAYEYDALGNLRQVTLPNGPVQEYVIDPENRRVGKKVNGTLTQGFLYEGQLRIAAELDGSGNVVSRFVYGTRLNVPEYMVKGGATYRIVTDHLGSPRFVIDASDGTIVQRMEYDEFGRVTFDTAPGFQPFGFGGGRYDRDTGIVRFGARDYDAATGRWTAKDPIRFAGGDTNLYGYVLNDPINGMDPSGLGFWNTWPWNGNMVPGFTPQNGTCDPPADSLNGTCSEQCCVRHDQCYERFQCNVTSWGPSLVLGPCKFWDLVAVLCVLGYGTGLP